MKRLVSLILIISFLLSAVAGAVFTFNGKAQAQLAVPTAEIPLSPLSASAVTTATNTTTTNILIGLPGTSQAAITAIRNSVGAACQAVISAADKSDAVETFVDVASSSFLSVIGGGIGESTQLTKSLTKATVAKECIDAYVTALRAIPTVTLTMGQDLQREQDKFTKTSEALRQVIENLKARQSAGIKDILKAFMVKLVLNLNKNLTTKLVNGMVQKYKIDDYLAYADALGTQIYSMKYINEHYSGDARTQMMLRSLIQSDKLPEEAKKLKTNVAKAFATTKAQDFIASKCANSPQLDANDSNSLICLASLGSEQANPNFQFQAAQDNAQKVKGAGMEIANKEVSQSNGFAPPRDCNDLLGKQQSIDAKWEQLSTEVVAAADVVAKLEAALVAKKTTQAEVDKARANFDKIDAQLKQLPQEDSDPVSDICPIIDSPATYVSDQITNFVKQHLDQGSQLKSDNLPFYATFLSDLASNFLTNLITGGKSNSKIFKEAGVTALNGAIGELSSQLPKATGPGLPPPSNDPPTPPDNNPNPNRPILSYIASSPGPEQDVQILVDLGTNFLNTDGSTRAARWVLEGPNIGGTGVGRVERNGSDFYAVFDPVKAPDNSTYKLTVYGSNGSVLRSVSLTVIYSRGRGSVAGTQTVDFSPRRSNFSPRGER